MAGTLTISQLSDGVNSTSVTNAIQGSAKAWVNFNGSLSTPITPRASYNISSITKNTTGDYTLNFTNAFVDTNYAVAGIVQFNQSGAQSDHNLMGAEITNSSNAMQTGSVRVVGKYGGSVSTYDMTTFCIAIFR